MAKKSKKIANKNNNSYIEPVIYLSDDAPDKLEDFVSELITMSGILRLSLILIDKKKYLYNYIRWGKSEKTLELENIHALIDDIKAYIKILDKKTIDYILIRTEDVNLLLFSVDRKILFLQCDSKAKLPLITLKARKVITKLAELRNI